MAIVLFDILAFANSNFWGTVIGGDAADGWIVMISNQVVPALDDASALQAQATFIAAPAGAPSIGSTFQFVQAGSSKAYLVDGYLTTPAFGGLTIFALLVNALYPNETALAIWNGSAGATLSWIP